MVRWCCRIMKNPVKQCLSFVVVLLFIWIIALIIRRQMSKPYRQNHNKVFRRYNTRCVTEIESALNTEIAVLMKQPPMKWKEFIRGPLAKNFKMAPCSCGSCNMSLPQCRPRQPLGNITKQVLAAEKLKLSNPYAIPAPHGTLPGGMFSPSCNGERVAIIIPFRDRWPQLKTLLMVLHPMLQRQQICYRVFVVEQYGNEPFNKGRLNNAGFLEISKRFKFDCIIYQDADIVPLEDRNPYHCHPQHPKHIGVAIDVFRFRLFYRTLVGGVLAFRTEHYVRVNGFSNLYWGWGAEDDDIEARIRIATKQLYVRPMERVARFKALSHSRQKVLAVGGSRRGPLFGTMVQRYAFDGLNTIEYKLISEQKTASYTHLMINVGKMPSYLKPK